MAFWHRMYEPKNKPLLSRAAFYRRVAAHGAVAMALIAFSIIVGMTGYILTEHMPALDAFLNVSMLLGGMGPINPLTTDAGKLFAGLFALYAGLVFIVCATVVMAPVLHRVLHHFHISDNT